MMWEQTLIESKGFHGNQKRWWTVPAAASLHAAVILTATFLSYWHVEAVEAPALPIRYFDAIQVQIGPPPKLGDGRRQGHKQNQKPPQIAKAVQPSIDQDLQPSQQENTFVSQQSEYPGEDLPPGDGNAKGILEGIGNGAFNNGIAGPPEVEEPRVITSDVTSPVLLRRIEPEYPLLAIRSRLQGTVILEAVITKTGEVEQIRTLRADYPYFEKAAKEAVLQWKYKPATVQGRPVKVYFTVTVTFRLR